MRTASGTASEQQVYTILFINTLINTIRLILKKHIEKNFNDSLSFLNNKINRIRTNSVPEVSLPVSFGGGTVTTPGAFPENNKLIMIW